MATYEPIDGRQQIWAVAEPPHIVVGNPRYLQNLVKLGRLRLSGVSVVVLDEVDACLIDADTRREIHELLSRRLSNTYQVYEEGTWPYAGYDTTRVEREHFFPLAPS